MVFGQQSGPPASSRQVQELLALVKEAGHADFRDARGPMGFTQRQAAGKFTRDEVASFIDRLKRPRRQRKCPFRRSRSQVVSPSATGSAPAC